MSDSQPQQPFHSPRSGNGNGNGNASAAEATTLLLAGARLTDGRTVDVRLGGGRIQAVGTTGSLPPPRCPEWT